MAARSSHSGALIRPAAIGDATAIYALLSYVFSWFDKNIAVSAGFILYLLILYVCVFLVYRTKRRITTGY